MPVFKQKESQKIPNSLRKSEQLRTFQNREIGEQEFLDFSDNGSDQFYDLPDMSYYYDGDNQESSDAQEFATGKNMDMDE